MKKMIASAGLVALGAAGVQAALPEYGPMDKPWSISATLRGFYDDNPSTVPDGIDKRESFGYEVSPAVSLNLPLGQTSVSLRYVFSYKRYDHEFVGTTDKDTQTHTFDFGVGHSFSERYQLSLSDSFVIGQEPDVLRAGDTFTTFQRIPGDNIRNFGTINFTAQLTRLFGVEVGYANSLYDYVNRGGTAGAPSHSGLLDRLEHRAHVDGHWQLLPQTVGVIGYQYGQVDYTADELIDIGLMSDNRNSRSHYGYVGLNHNFRSDLSGTVRAGVRYQDFYNDPNNTTDLSPYAQASLQYSYLPECYLQVGFTHDRTATDQVSTQGSSFTRDQEVSAAFASINHRIMPQLYGSLMGQFQHSTVNGGSLDGKTERIYLIGLNLEYRFNRNFSAEAGYNFDKLESDASNRNYDRNRVYLGVTASY